ncbi:MAG: sulfite exporter TauE/SafE family protein [Magnetococcales bacterium]|nr:sulfite exporter TauE/SafE family protein [Magnetococcales bacterium]
MEASTVDYWALLTVPLLMGLASLPHCFAMCGTILGALTSALPAATRSQPSRLLLFLLMYGGGRVVTYAILGVIAALPGFGLVQLGGASVRFAMQALAALVLLATGLYLGGWWGVYWSRLERMTNPLWHWLQPMTRRLIPTRSPLQAVAFGLIWGCLPCGMVYAALVWSATAPASPMVAAASMALFGLGTLPFTLGGGLVSGRLLAFYRSPWLRRSAAIVLIVIGVGSLAWSSWRLLAPPMAHQPHQPHHVDPAHLTNTHR